MRPHQENAVDTAKPEDVQRMPRLSAQQQLDEERGISPRTIIVGALRMTIGGPAWLIEQTAELILLALVKLGYSIVPTEAKRGE